MIEIQKVTPAKIFLFVFLCLLLVCLRSIKTQAVSPVSVQVTVDGKSLDMPVQPMIVDGRILVGLRSIGEAMGGDVTWNESTKQVILRRRSDIVLLTVGQKQAIVNNKSVTLDVEPQLLQDRTMVPLRFVAEALGATVVWDAETRTAQIWRKPIEIESMTYTKDVGKARVTLSLSEPPQSITPQLQESTLSLQLFPAVIKTDETALVIYDTLLKSLQLQTDGRTVRLQAYLWTPPNYRYSLSDDGMQLTVEFDYTITEIRPQYDGRALTVNIAATGKLNYTTLELKDPPRLVLDVAGAHLAPSIPTSLSVGDPLLSRVRTAIFSKELDTIRIVLDIARAHPYEVIRTDLGLQIRFYPQIEAVTTQKLQGITRLTVTGSLPMDASITTANDQRQIRIEIPQTRSGLKENVLKIADGAVDTITVTPATSTTPALILINLPYYLGHTISSKAGDASITLDLITSPVYKKRIWVDAGHGKIPDGNDDSGTVGTTYKTLEKVVNLQVALELKRQLEEAGAQVLMTRIGNEGVNFTERPKLANAQKPPIDLFISIHHNSSSAASTRGTETYYWTTNPKSRVLADFVHAAVVKSLHFPDRQVRLQDFTVIKETLAPSVLVELGYLSNPAEEKEIAEPGVTSKSYPVRAARGILNGIFNFFSQAVGQPSP